MHLILDTKNLKHQAELAVAYGTALRLTEVTTLRFRDISFIDGTVTISEEVSKSRYAGKVELPVRLRNILRQYWEQCCRGAKPDDWLFPGQRPGSHISKGTLQQMFKNRLLELGWDVKGDTVSTPSGMLMRFTTTSPVPTCSRYSRGSATARSPVH